MNQETDFFLAFSENTYKIFKMILQYGLMQFRY